MTALERRLQQLEAQLEPEGPTLADVLRERLAWARHHPGARRPLPEGDDPLTQRLRRAIARADEARARLQAGEPGPW